MSCVLRIDVDGSELNHLLEQSAMPPYRVDRKGEPSCIHFNVSDADFNDLKLQIVDAISFLKRNEDVLKYVMGHDGVSGGELDFGVERRDVAVQVDRLPPELLRLAGLIDIGVTLSYYDPAEDD